MSDQPNFEFNTKIITNGDMSGSITSTVQPVAEALNLAVQATWSGSSPVGTTSLQASLDNVTFVTIDDSSLAVSGNTGSNFYNIADVGYPYIRAVYTSTSGTGTINVQICGKLN